MDKLTGVLPPNQYIGHDGKNYIDLAVDSGSGVAVVWLRRRLHDGRIFMVVSLVRGHVFRKELSENEAKEVYWELADKLPVDQAFPTTIQETTTPDAPVDAKDKKSKPKKARCKVQKSTN